MERSISTTVKSKDGSTVDMSDISHAVWTLSIDTDRVYRDLSLVNIPQNITKLTLGDNLSMSISRPIYLPRMLKYYKGPILYGMEIPSSVDTIVSIITMVSQDTSLLSIDENIDLTTIDLKSSYNLSSTLSDIMKCSPVLDNVRVVYTPLVQEAITKTLPHLNHLEVTLDDSITSFADIWDNILLDGSVSVNRLTVVSPLGYEKNVLDNLYVLFENGNRLCEEVLTIKGLGEFKDNDVIYLLNLARSLVNTHGLTIEIEYENEFPLDMIGRLAKILKCNDRHVYKNGSFMFSSFFGATDSSIYTDGYRLFITKRQGPNYFNFMEPEYAPEPTPTPVSSTFVVPMDNDIEPESRKFKLYTWTKCGYCKKQEDIVSNFRSRGIEEAKLFDDNVEIVSVEDPSEVQDPRVRGFPTWVINDELFPGVKDESMLESLLV